MFSKPDKRRIDLSFLTYLTDDDLNNQVVNIETIKKRFPHIANCNLECFKMYLILNFQVLNETERENIEKTIKLLQKHEADKYYDAISYINQCQQLKSLPN